MAVTCSRCGRKRTFAESLDNLGTPDSWLCPECGETIQREKQERLAKLRTLVTNILVTTAFEFAGYEVVQHLGIVRGIVVRSRSALGTVGASLQTIVGGDITLFTQLCEDSRRDAFDRMLMHAAELDANGVIGVRYDATEIAQGVAEVLAYGTAVRIRQIGTPRTADASL